MPPLPCLTHSRRSGKAQQHQQKKTLLEVLTPYEARKALFDHLSAYDTAKLDMALGGVLDDAERKRYLNPVRDLIYDVPAMDSLLQDGMKLMLFGADVAFLQQRLHNTKDYLKHYGHERKLQVYLLGSFPIYSSTSPILDKVIEFSINGEPSKSRVFTDKTQLKRMKQRLWMHDWGVDKTFLMAFGAPASLFKGEAKGFWYKVPDVPDGQTDLRVYVPCYQDRIWGRVRVPLREIPRISACALQRVHVPDMILNLYRVYSGKYRLDERVYLTANGFSVSGKAAQEEISVRFGSRLAPVAIIC